MRENSRASIHPQDWQSLRDFWSQRRNGFHMSNQRFFPMPHQGPADPRGVTLDPLFLPFLSDYILNNSSPHPELLSCQFSWILCTQPGDTKMHRFSSVARSIGSVNYSALIIFLLNFNTSTPLHAITAFSFNFRTKQKPKNRTFVPKEVRHFAVRKHLQKQSTYIKARINTKQKQTHKKLKLPWQGSSERTSNLFINEKNVAFNKISQLKTEKAH